MQIMRVKHTSHIKMDHINRYLKKYTWSFFMRFIHGYVWHEINVLTDAHKSFTCILMSLYSIWVAKVNMLHLYNIKLLTLIKLCACLLLLGCDSRAKQESY